MAYPKLPTPERKVGVGLSFDPETIRLVDVLAGGRGERSRFMRDTLDIGLESRFGENWREIARQRIEQEVEAA